LKTPVNGFGARAIVYTKYILSIYYWKQHPIPKISVLILKGDLGAEI